MFGIFKKSQLPQETYLERIQRRTREGIERGSKETLEKTKMEISKASYRGNNSVKVSYDDVDREKVDVVAEALNKEGFKTQVSKGVYSTILEIQW